jgi:hypothetical protein
MKPVIALLSCSLFIVARPVVGKQLPLHGGLFSDDLSQYDKPFEKLSSLEALVSENGQTYSEIASNYSKLSRFLVEEADISDMLLNTNTPKEEWYLGVPGFLWGFCCSALGVMVMLLSFDDLAVQRRETRAALIGCAIGTCTWIALYAWFVFVTLEF